MPPSASSTPVTAPRAPRLFLAIWPSEALRTGLHAYAAEVLRRAPGRPAAAAKLHLTLVFLGAVEPPQRECVEQAASAVEIQPFELVLDQAGCWRRSGILWAGAARVPPPLLQLVGELNTRLADCGFAPDPREYRAHVTLARNVRCREHAPAFAPLVWRVERFALVESRALPIGAVYETLRSWELG